MSEGRRTDRTKRGKHRPAPSVDRQSDAPTPEPTGPLDRWIERAKRHQALTVAIAFVIWFVPLLISLDANRAARRANDLSRVQASPHINPTEVFFGADISTDGHVGVCRHIVLLSNQGGIGTAVVSVRTRLRVDSRIVTSESIGTGNDRRVQYYTRSYGDTNSPPPLHEVITTNSLIRVQPLYSFLLVPSGETVALVLDTEVIGHFKLLGSPEIGPGTSGFETEVPVSAANVTVQYTLQFPGEQQIATRPMGCLVLGP